MHKIKIAGTDTSFSFLPGETLLSLLLEQGLYVNNPCNGAGTCGKCRVRILDGDAGIITATEKDFLSQREISSGIRLSCMVYPEKSMTVELSRQEGSHKILTDGYTPNFENNCDICKKTIRIQQPSLEAQTSFETLLRSGLKTTLGDVPLEIPYGTLKDFSFNEGIYTAVIHEKPCGGALLISLERGDTSDRLYGIAVDIGTTTLAASLIDMNTGKEAASSSMLNPQKYYGLDVLTRIAYETEKASEGKAALQQSIVEALNHMTEDMCMRASVDKSFIYEISAAANCTMMHMLLGIDAISLGKAPYAPLFTDFMDISASDIGLKASQGARLYCLPSVSAYIGADIVAGAYVCGLHKSNENILFIDIGTNGEIVFSDRGKLLSCSCAAGPALEGMNISCGMRASGGAVEDIKIEDDKILLSTIDNLPASGLCGSGILAAVRELLRAGLLRSSGAFIKAEHLKEDDFRRKLADTYMHCDGSNSSKRFFSLSEKSDTPSITQGDIRQVQLAKGAILSGLLALLDKAGTDVCRLDKVIIAGQFGSHLPAESLAETGLIPQEVCDRLVYVGNSSKTGAYMALMSATVKREMEELARKIDYMELGASEGYERLFAECLKFPDNTR